MSDYAWNLKYSPDQPRVPVGNSEGGQWTSASGGATDRAIRDYEDSIRSRDVERLGVFTEYGTLVYELGGGPEGLRVDRAGWRRLQLEASSQLGGIHTYDHIMTHNHPISSAIFSYEDLAAAKDLGLAELRLVMPDGTRYSVAPKGRARGESWLRWPPRREIKKAMLKERPEMSGLLDDLKKKMTSGTLTNLQAAEILWNATWPLAAEDLDLDFMKEVP